MCRFTRKKIHCNNQTDSLTTAYTQLQNELGTQTSSPKSTKEKLVEVYNHIDFLEKQMAKFKGEKEAFREGIRKTTKEMRMAREG